MRDATLSRRDVLPAGGALAAIAAQSALVPKLRPPVMLAGCGHWTEQERAPEVLR